MNALQYAIQFLIGLGISVEPDDRIPGLYWVDGRELTTGQVIDFAFRKGMKQPG